MAQIQGDDEMRLLEQGIDRPDASSCSEDAPETGRNWQKRALFAVGAGTAVMAGAALVSASSSSNTSVLKADVAGAESKCGEFVKPYFDKIQAQDATGILTDFNPNAEIGVRNNGVTKVYKAGDREAGLKSVFKIAADAGCSSPTLGDHYDDQHWLTFTWGCSGKEVCMYIDFDVSSSATYWNVNKMTFDMDGACKPYDATDPLKQ